jgi:hypothetical protein
MTTKRLLLLSTCLLLFAVVVRCTTVRVRGEAQYLDPQELAAEWNRPRRLNPYVEGPAPGARKECSRRNGCLETMGRHPHRLDTVPIAQLLGKAQDYPLRLSREPGYPPDSVHLPVKRFLTDIPKEPKFLPNQHVPASSYPSSPEAYTANNQ